MRRAPLARQLLLRESLTPRLGAGFIGAFTVVIGVAGLLTARMRGRGEAARRGICPIAGAIEPRSGRCDREGGLRWSQLILGL